MSKTITNINDYTGFGFTVDNNTNHNFFENFAFDIEKKILRGDNTTNYGLLGDEVYIALIADLDSNNAPQTAPYINLVNGVNYIQTNGENTVFCGIKKMLTYFVYAELLKDNLVTKSGKGLFKTLTESSERTIRSSVNYNAHKRWNYGVDLYNKEVYDYILFYQSDFTNWKFTAQSKFITQSII